jgi:hypothetical protein
MIKLLLSFLFPDFKFSVPSYLTRSRVIPMAAICGFYKNIQIINKLKSNKLIN